MYKTIDRLLANIFKSKTFSRQVRALTQASDYESVRKLALDKDGNSVFWRDQALEHLRWSKPFTRINECDFAAGKIKWFADGELNVSVNCLDRHVEADPNRVALIFERDEPGSQEFVTYKELLDMTCRIANVLRSSGVKKGDTVVLYLSVSPTIVAVMLACARIGAIHSVVFAGFSADALAARIQDANAVVVVTADQAKRGGKTIDLKKTVDAAVAQCPSVKHVFMSRRTGNDVPTGPKDIVLEDAMSGESAECAPETMNAEDPLFILYTSGSTGKPKGIQHSSGGYLLYAALTHKICFDYRSGDLFGCVADVGWITGHSYVVYGPLCNGGTSLLFESTPIFPDPGRYWETVQRLKLTHIYLAPTSLRLLLKFGDEFVRRYDRSSLRVLGCVGEPLNHEAWHWFHEVVGERRCDIIDTWWQTETGGICIAPRPSMPKAPILPAMPMRPFFGIEPCLMDEKGQEISAPEAYGSLCLKRPWPGMARTIWGDHQRFIDTYFKPFPGVYFSGDGAFRHAGHYYSGDGAHRHSEGQYQITGRMDDVINVSGHRLGTAEIEDALDEHDAVAESAVVGYPHDVKGEGIYAFITLKAEFASHPPQDMQKALKERVATAIAKYAVPDFLLFTDSLPKTRSGKIMRRVLRKIAANKEEDLGDISTLADPSVVEAIIAGHRAMMQKGG